MRFPPNEFLDLEAFEGTDQEDSYKVAAAKTIVDYVYGNVSNKGGFLAAFDRPPFMNPHLFRGSGEPTPVLQFYNCAKLIITKEIYCRNCKVIIHRPINSYERAILNDLIIRIDYVEENDRTGSGMPTAILLRHYNVGPLQVLSDDKLCIPPILLRWYKTAADYKHEDNFVEYSCLIQEPEKNADLTAFVRSVELPVSSFNDIMHAFKTFIGWLMLEEEEAINNGHS